MNKREILCWLHETDDRQLQQLWRQADDLRRQHVGDAVHLRGLIEVSNYCSRHCAYCGIGAHRTNLTRYRMSADEVLAAARQARQLGYGTVVLQGGEDPHLTGDWVAEVVAQIKQQTGLAITLSLGERPGEQWAQWRAAGADRYLMRFETSDERLYTRLHCADGRTLADRLAGLQELRQLGYEVGSGCLIGLPGQTWDMLARDIALFAELDLDMIGCGPFIPHPDTPLGRNELPAAPADQQVPADIEVAYKVVALARLVCPGANIPATTAVATLNIEAGRETALARGANVIMPNLTPIEYRACYELYPAKACVSETASQCGGCVRRRIESIGRTVGQGAGESPNYRARAATPGHAR